MFSCLVKNFFINSFKIVPNCLLSIHNESFEVTLLKVRSGSLPIFMFFNNNIHLNELWIECNSLKALHIACFFYCWAAPYSLQGQLFALKVHMDLAFFSAPSTIKPLYNPIQTRVNHISQQNLFSWRYVGYSKANSLNSNNINIFLPLQLLDHSVIFEGTQRPHFLTAVDLFVLSMNLFGLSLHPPLVQQHNASAI